MLRKSRQCCRLLGEGLRIFFYRFLISFSTAELRTYDCILLVQQCVFDTLAMLWEGIARESIWSKIATFACFLGRLESAVNDLTEESQDHFLLLWLGINTY